MPSTRRRYLIAALVGLPLLGAIAIGVVRSNSVTESDVKLWIASELPIGSPKANVVAFCERHGLTHSATYLPDLYYNKTKSFNASVPTHKAWPLEGGIYVVFQFDSEDKLRQYTTSEQYTFL